MNNKRVHDKLLFLLRTVWSNGEDYEHAQSNFRQEVCHGLFFRRNTTSQISSVSLQRKFENSRQLN